MTTIILVAVIVFALVAAMVLLPVIVVLVGVGFAIDNTVNVPSVPTKAAIEVVLDKCGFTEVILDIPCVTVTP